MEASDETAPGHHDPRRRAYHKSEDSQRTRAYNPAKPAAARRRSDRMRRRSQEVARGRREVSMAPLRTALALLALVMGGTALGQETRAPRIGWIAIGSREAYRTIYENFRQGLQDVGYVEGRNLILEPRLADGVPARVPGLIDDLLD